MKTPLIALAVLGTFAGAASAQSSVSIYGIADVWVGGVDTGAAGGSMTVQQSGGLSVSRLGFKGSEDLGGGLSAIFGLEAALSVDDGTAGGMSFNRQSFVGFEGGFGQLIAGKVWTAFEDVSAAAFSGFDSPTFTPEYAIFGSALYAANPDNGFKYTTPDFGGFGGAISYALKENTGVKTTAFHLKYADGPLYVGGAYQEEADSLAATKAKFTRLGASYDFGVAKLLGTYGQVKLTGGGKVSDYAVGVDVPVGGAVLIGAGYARSKDNAVLGSTKREAFGLVATYSLSKRTTAYAAYTSADAKAGGVKVGELDLYGVGIRHTF